MTSPIPLPTGATITLVPPRPPGMTFGPPVGTTLTVFPSPGPQGISGAAADGAPIIGEIPAGIQDGVNLAFTTVTTFAVDSTAVYRNGLREVRGVGYTETGSDTVTFTTAPLSSDDITIDYIIEQGGS